MWINEQEKYLDTEIQIGNGYKQYKSDDKNEKEIIRRHINANIMMKLD